MNIPTGEEFLNKNSLVFLAYPQKILIEFAKLHVKAALKAAYENIEYTTVDSSVPYVVEESILNSYPLSNIK